MGRNFVFAAGLTTSCLYNASEALRLGSSLFSLTSFGTAAATSGPSQPSALPLNPSTDPNDMPNPSVTPKHPESPSPSQAPGNALMKNAGVSDSTQDAADDAADAAAQAARTKSRAGGVDQSGVDGVGYWQVAWLYLTSLLKLGEVYETAGSHEDAAHAFKEGLELVCRFLSCILILQHKHAYRPAALPSVGHMHCISCVHGIFDSHGY